MLANKALEPTLAEHKYLKTKWLDIEDINWRSNLLSLIENFNRYACNQFRINTLPKSSCLAICIDSKNKISDSNQLAAISSRKGVIS
ncbi:hypothetical protein [Prochlorococcus marinus]|uniref:hypothetical protein n=1 Tax=Prochlorococcus sp. MIT 1323 TaxID=3082526 RepID=UPI0007B38792|nr:hypothetical protein PMIT1323_01180 [Prochlorococcus marinus str. MIT 1323]